MKCLLVFVPQWSPLQPYLATPSLVAWLNQQGHQATQYDLNVNVYDYILSREYLENCVAKLQADLGRLDPEESSAAEHYEAIARALALSEVVIPKVDLAKEHLRSPRFTDINRTIEYKKLLESALVIVSTRFYPTAMSFSTFRMDLSPRSSRQVLTALDDATNPFREWIPRFLPELLNSDPDVIGISITDQSQLIPGLTLARLLRSARPQTHVVIGGALFTRLADEPDQLAPVFDFVDSIIVREGERPLLHLLNVLESGGNLDEVPNLLYRRADGTVTTPLTLPNVGMEALPTPDFDGLPLSKYLSPEPILPVLTSRGCPWGICTFCDHSYAYESGGRFRPIDMIVEDLDRLQRRYGARYFFFADEDFPPARAAELSSAILNAQLKVHWSVETRLDARFNADLVGRMAESGCRYVMFGLESASPRILKLMKKGISPRSAEEIIARFHRAGVWTHVFVIHRFPGEEPEDSLETAGFLRRNASVIDSFGYSPFTLNRHAPIRNNYAEYGIRSLIINEDYDYTLYYEFDLPGHPGTAGAYAEVKQIVKEILPAYPHLNQVDLIGREHVFLCTGYGLTERLRNPGLGGRLLIEPELHLSLARSPLAGFARLPWKLVNEAGGWRLQPGSTIFGSVVGTETIFEVPNVALELLSSCEREGTLERAVSWHHQASGLPTSNLLSLARELVHLGLAIPSPTFTRS
ncbi:MAG: B12-binding domain-containing radical SAM protein [Bacillota bacterium]